MSDPITVTQFNDRISNCFKSSPLLNDVQVMGEIVQIKIATSGHIYLDLKDDRSILKCAVFRSRVAYLKFRPKSGDKVVVFGSISFYSPSGSVTFVVESMKPYGEGEQKKALEELINRLLKEGLFDPERKKPLPRYPKVIGVVTSPTGAVIKDIIDTSAKRFPADILLAPAKVQGDRAAESIVHGINLLNSQGVDVIIVGRGGGSSEDLFAFNSEIVARAIASSKVPVISAVGHATDKSIADRVADKYAETPTMAATLATAELKGESDGIRALEIRMMRALYNVVDRMKSRFSYPDSKLDSKNAVSLVAVKRSVLEHAESNLDHGIATVIGCKRAVFAYADSKLDPRRARDSVDQSIMGIDVISDRMDRAILVSFERCRNGLSLADGSLRADNPQNILNRGFSYISDGSGRALTSVKSISKGADITVRMRDGTAVAKVKEVINNE